MLPAYRAVTRKGEHLLKIWCQHCKKFHIHGGISEEPGAGDGHRVAHCWRDDSPYKRSGYELREVGPFTAEAAREARASARR
ncbi:MAG: hypothetical protein GEU94_02195 [Micromonosporaceae bacterium]|nr:hypothetical protein [Micromonosporaceae bacterium]